MCLLPNMNLLIEGGMLEQSVEVYKMENDAGLLGEPSQVIQANARGLTAIEYNSKLVFMGF